MLIVTGGYCVYNEWDCISIGLARNTARLKMPDKLAMIYQAISEKNIDKSARLQTELTEKDLTVELPTYYRNVLFELSNIPKEKVDVISVNEITEFFQAHFFSIVYGLKYNDFDQVKGIESFEYAKKEYLLPESLAVIDTVKPFCNVTTLEFTEVSDIDKNSAKMEGRIFEFASLIIAILCRPKNEKLNIRKVEEQSKKFDDLPCTILWEVYYLLYSTHEHIRKIHPKMFNNDKSKPVMIKEIDKLGWRASVLGLAKQKIFDKTGLSSIEAVEQSNMWDFLEALNYERISK